MLKPLLGFNIKLVLGFIALSVIALANPKPQILSSYLVEPKDSVSLENIANQFEIVHRKGHQFEIIVPEGSLKQLLPFVKTIELVRADLSDEITQAERSGVLRGYRTYESVQSELKTLNSKFPEITKLENYGSSKSGRPLTYLKISDNAHLDEVEAKLLLTSATHGDELISVEVLMGILNKLLDGYGTDPRVTAMIDRAEIYFVPAVSPDGYALKSRYVNGVDPNRDYPWPEMPSKNSIPCIKNIMRFVEEKGIQGSIDFHASGELIMYPWAYTYSPVESFYEKIFSELSREMAATNGYRPGQISVVIYVAKGSSADYYFWKNKSLSFGVEVAQSKVPPTSQIPIIVNDNLEMTYRFIEHFTN